MVYLMDSSEENHPENNMYYLIFHKAEIFFVTVYAILRVVDAGVQRRADLQLSCHQNKLTPQCLQNTRQGLRYTRLPD